MKQSIFALLLLLFALASSKAQTCQCVAYVKNRYTIYGGVGAEGGAKDYGPILTNSTNKFVIASIPQNKDSIVIQPAFGACTDPIYGHIALVGTVTNNPDGTTSLVLYGANQKKSPEWFEWGCSNVSTCNITLTTANRKYVSFYRNLSKLKTQ